MNNPPAFPNPHLRDDSGMTMRDYFAGMALQGFVLDYVYDNSDEIAERAYTIADAMLKAREA